MKENEWACNQILERHRTARVVGIYFFSVSAGIAIELIDELLRRVRTNVDRA